MGSALSLSAEPPFVSTWTSGGNRGIPMEAGQRWTGTNTVSFIPSCVPAFGWPVKAQEGKKKAQTYACEPVCFDGIGVYASDACKDGGHPSDDTYAQRTREALQTNWPFVLGEELMDGTWSALAGDAISPFSKKPISNSQKGATIRSAATTIPGDPVCLKAAIVSLVREWRRYEFDPDDQDAPKGHRQGTTPVLHIPDYYMGCLPDGPTTLRGREVTTNYGTLIVAPGPGYSGLPPGVDLPTEVPAMPTGEFWAYLSGPVFYEIRNLPDIDEFDERKNMDFDLSESNAIAIFDPCAVFGIAVKECLCDC